MSLVKCADCGSDVSSEAAACPKCGRPVRRMVKCADCGQDIPTAATACPKCGRPVRPEENASAGIHGSETLGWLILAVPILATLLTWTWISGSHHSKFDFLIVEWAVIVCTAVLALVEARKVGMGAPTDLRSNGKRREGPTLWFFAVLLLLGAGNV